MNRYLTIEIEADTDAAEEMLVEEVTNFVIDLANSTAHATITLSEDTSPKVEG